MRLMDVRRSSSEGARRPSDFSGGVPAASNCRSSEFKRKRTQQNIPEISRKLEDDFGCPFSYDYTPPNSPINLSASGSSHGSDSEDSTDFSPVKLRPRKFNFSPPRLLPALTAALSNKKRGFTFAMSPPRDLLRRHDFVASEVPTARRSRQEAPQDVEEDAGPYLQHPPCASEGALSADADNDTTYRFNETLREPKPPRKYRGAQPKRQPDKVDTAQAVEALQLHRKQQAEERVAAGRRRWKALDTPKDCAYIQIDGMDQKKTAMPHFAKQPKSVDGAALVGVHLVGAMIFHGKRMTRAFLTYNNIKSDTNLTITKGVPSTKKKSLQQLRRLKNCEGECLANEDLFTLDHDVQHHDQRQQIGQLTSVSSLRYMITFLAVLADDEISFWICQIIKIIDRNEAGEPKKVQLQWYTTEDSNPYTGKFYPEKRRSNGKGRAVLYKQDVDLEEVTILSFSFIFTTTRRLRKVTERQIRKGLFRIARDRHASLPQNQLDADLQIGSEDDEEADCSGPDDDDEDD
ncbi:hypothetical protein R1sor_017077 [Riccia sorocarpa]|uniref:Uncharacterized protein n=1 Tax=Riccia sorocarpa TaxID=122646 RepID=A0ABD3I9D7_9MARC